MGSQKASSRTRGHFGPGVILQVIRTGDSWTRADLVKKTGLGRTAVAERLEVLVKSGYVTISDHTTLTGGRPADTYSFNADAGRMLVADIGGSHTRLGLVDLSGRLLGSAEVDLDADRGADAVLKHMVKLLGELTHELGADPVHIRAIGIGVPGPVAGGVMRRPHLPGWEGVSIPNYFAEAYPDVPVAVDKDANILARGERSRDPVRLSNIVVLKVGMGLSCGVIVDGAILQGSVGAVGDISHLPRGGSIKCTCGQFGCLETVASGRAIARELARTGKVVHTSRQIVDLVRQNDVDAIQLIRQAGRDLGGALGSLSAILNPSRIIIGGNLAELPEALLAGIRETIYSDFPPSLTGNLQILPSALGAAAGLTGAAELALDLLLAPHNVDAALS